jgi:hypothetical protein
MHYSIALVVLLAVLGALTTNATVYDFEELGALADDQSDDTMWLNGGLLNKTLNSLQEGDVFVVPNKTFHTQGGILVTSSLKHVSIVLDGTLSFANDRTTFPRDESDSVMECLQFNELTDVTFTSSGGPDNRGTINGNGQAWWGAIKYLKYAEDRPRLFRILKSKSILFEKIALVNSPRWTFWAQNCNGLEVRNSEIDARWDQADRHTLLDLQAFNTDGFDVSGKYVYIHDVRIWNDDDCVCVKDDSEHMLFENIYASGLGLVVGSIGGQRVNNITFRNAIMERTVKGIYMKTRWSDSGPVGEEASISNVLYENITIVQPEQFAIWIGPAQQNGQPCSLAWPESDRAECIMTGYQTWSNITLKDIYISDPLASPGVLMGNSSNPMQGVTFTNVVFSDMKEGLKPWGKEYFCTPNSIIGSVSGATTPQPGCFIGA